MKGLAENETFDESSLTALHNQAVSIRMTAPIGTEEQASFGLDNPQAVISLETAAKTYTLLVGAKDEADNYVFSSSESPYYVRISGFTGNNFVDKTRADFLKEPPAEEEGSESDSSQ